MAQADPETPGPDRPSSARIHNALAGGWNCTPADEAKAAELEEICPPVRQMGADSRLFTVRAVTWAAAEQGISQLIDLGAGLPPGPSVHEMARAVRPGARVAYVDHDDEVADFLAHEAPGEGIAVVNADLRDPAAVMADPGLLKVIDPDQPALIVLALVLHLLPPGLAAGVVAGYARRLAPGSLIAVSVPWVGDERTWERLVPANPGPAWNHSRDDLLRFLDTLAPVPPGISAAFALRPGQWGAARCRSGPACTLAAVGRKR